VCFACDSSNNCILEFHARWSVSRPSSSQRTHPERWGVAKVECTRRARMYTHTHTHTHAHMQEQSSLSQPLMTPVNVLGQVHNGIDCRRVRQEGILVAILEVMSYLVLWYMCKGDLSLPTHRFLITQHLRLRPSMQPPLSSGGSAPSTLVMPWMLLRMLDWLCLPFW